MKHVSARASFVLAVLLALIAIGFLAFPDMLAMFLFCTVSGASASRRRSRTSHRIAVWGDRVFRLACFVLRIETEFRFSGQEPDGALIAISNHQSTLDAFSVLAVLRRLRRDNTCWIVKEEIRWAPVINVMAFASGCIFVKRRRDPRDYRRIADGAKRIREDRAILVLFPEGTRFTRPKDGYGFSHVLPPKRGGFEHARKLLPDAAILSITQAWSEGAIGNGHGKTMWDVASLYRKRLVLHAQFFAPEEVAADADWLTHDFIRKDDLIDLVT